MEVTIPALGMAMTEALLVEWLKQPGDLVSAGEPIAEIETDKATIELESPAAGVLGPHLFTAGSMIPIAEPVCRILDLNEVEESEPTATERVATEPVATEPGAMEPSVMEPTPDDTVVGTATVESPAVPEPHPAVPAFEGIFDELRHVPERDPLPSLTTGAPHGVDPAMERRTPHTQSPRQRRLARLAAQDGPPTEQSPPGSRRRAAIAARVAESWRTIPHFAVARELDASGVADALRELRHDIPAATVTDLLLHACAAIFVALPGSSSGDVGLAVATPDGVMMPVILGAARLSPADLMSARQAATRRARESRLAPADLSTQPTGSLSNLGALGVDSFTGIIPLGQQCLVTVGRIAPRIVASDGAFSFRDTINTTLNVDHRVIDGDVAARALEAFGQALGSLNSWVKGDTQ
jgi:pyruvate dehydrogenase E2 component (dihydrolipoamide acetyltransferase)